MKDLPKIEKSFKYWEQVELRDYFGLLEQKKFAPLQNWITTELPINQDEIRFLKELLAYAEPRMIHWNETELRENFIIDLTKKVRFDDYQQEIASFSERTLAISIQNKIVQAKLYGIADWFVATGLHKPKSPFFFIHEYKAEEGKVLDGRGQLLAAMYTAQQLNQKPPTPTIFNPNPIHFYKDIPIYGAYITGRYWHFVALKGTKYGISKPYISTELEDLQAIFKTLKAQKQIIFSYLEK